MNVEQGGVNGGDRIKEKSVGDTGICQRAAEHRMYERGGIYALCLGIGAENERISKEKTKEGEEK